MVGVLVRMLHCWQLAKFVNLAGIARSRRKTGDATGPTGCGRALPVPGAEAFPVGNAPMSSQAERRWAHEQALASARIEGHVPTPEFLADCEAVIAGTMTNEEARGRSLARALAKDRAAKVMSPTKPDAA